MSTKFSRLSAVAGVALASAVGTAQAVNIATDDIGEVIVGSYYTAQPGFQTLINLTNTQDVPVAVKIRIHEARNSRDVLDYTLTLSAFDVYTAVIREVTNPTTGNPHIVVRNTDDVDANGRTSCTVPQSRKVAGSGPTLNPASDFILSTAAYGATTEGELAFALDDDTGPAGIERLREGYIEIISMGYALKDLDDTLYPDQATTGAVVSGERIDIGYAIENHQCDRVQASFSNLNGPTAARIVETARQMGEPINAIKGNFRVLNIANGTESDVPALTLANFYNGDSSNFADPTAALGTASTAGWRVADSLAQACTLTRGTRRDTGNTQWLAGNEAAGGSCNNLITKQVTQAFLEPTLNDAYPTVANLLLDGPNAAFSLTPQGRNLLNRARGIDAVSALIQRKTVVNEWVSNTFDDGTVATDWVLTMPTKLFYVDGGVGPQAAIYASYVDSNTTVDTDRKVRPEAILLNTMVAADGTTVTNDPTVGVGPRAGFGPVGASAYRPFAEAFAQSTTGVRESAESCVRVGINLYDRAEQTVAEGPADDGVSVSPAPPRPVQFDDICYEVNVVSFDGRDGGLGHVALSNDLDITTTALSNRAGWLQLTLASGTDAADAYIVGDQAVSGDDVALYGLPVIGFALKERVFGTASANYSSTASHAYLREARAGLGGNLITGVGPNGVVLTGGAGL